MGRRYLRAALCILIALTVPLTLVFCAFALPPQYGETYLAGLPLKWDRLRSARSPRILLVGGSGAAFDVRCDLLEEELPGYEAVNFGLYAGLGTTVMLDLAMTQIREGDIVIFMPELSGQTLSAFFGAEAMWQAADGRFDLLTALGSPYRNALLSAFPAFAASKLRLYRDDAAPAGDGIYARSSFNAYGDIDAPGRERNVMPGGFDGNMPIRFDPSLPDEAFLARVHAAAAACERAGARLYYRFCPMNAAAIPPGEADRLGDFAAALRDRLDCEILGDPSESVMESGWFFDTNFHLNAAGAVAATAMLARDLKTALGGDASVSITVPDMPAPETLSASDGDDRDEDCFLFEQADGGWRIVGLTAEGLSRERLTVPVSHGGQPVLGFEAGVFAGSGRLREIVLQENVRSIPDGAFDGCHALERITVRNEAPATCSVGAGLLAGTDALGYVPSGRVSAYCTDYFWAVHADRIRADGAETTEPDPEPQPAAAAPGPTTVLYLGNGGSLRRQEGDSVTRAMDSAHLRVNTLQGVSYFERDGYVLLGWSTAPEGGDIIGLGSRTERTPGLTLYAQWAAENRASDFTWEAVDGGVRILGYRGGGVCVIPEKIDGLPVRSIGAGAFRSAKLERLVLPPSLQSVEPGAFEDCVIRELTLFDSLTDVSDAGFSGSTLQTLRVNAAVSPVYSGSYYDTFADKYDRLLSLQDEPKLVLASGSSGRYGYDSAMLDAAFPDFAVVNMGVYAYSNARPQLDLILGQMREGDILLSAPEFDAIPEQFCVSESLDHHFWAMMESNYDAVSQLDLRQYTAVFDSFAAYQRIRGGMEPKNYGVSPSGFDDDGNAYPFPTYNEYGDFILPRPNGDRDERQHANTADYTVDSFPEETVESLNEVYRRFLERGVSVYFSYTPRNRSSLTEASTPEARKVLHAYLQDRLCVPVISDMEDYLMSGIYFWKIDSHTSSEGAQLRTARVIEDLILLLD